MLSVMVAVVAIFVIALLRRDRIERAKYIRSFKNGKVAVVYLCSVPLYWLGYMCDGDLPAESMWDKFHIFDSFFNAIQASVELVVLKYTIDPITNAMAISPLYRWVVYFCFMLAILNALLFVFSIVSQYMWRKYQSLCFKCSTKDKLFIFGNNPQNHLIFRSDSRRKKVIVDKISKEEQHNLYTQDIFYRNEENVLALVDEIVAERVGGKRQNVVIVNTNDEIRNIEICHHFNRAIAALTPEEQMHRFNHLKIFTFGDPQNESIYEDIVQNGHGCVTYVNKYQKVAINIIEQHPFSLYLTKDQVDCSTACIRDGVEINALLIGFGKTNQQLFLTSVANNQFIAQGAKGVELKQVNYHIFDCDAIASSKRLNHTYNRYRNEVLDNPGVKQDDYLTLPSMPAATNFHNLNINATEFYNDICNVVTAKPESANFVVIAFGSDLVNIDMAKKLACKFEEWGVLHYKIFVKVRRRCNELALAGEKNCVAVGNEDEIVYNIENILTDRLVKMAQMRDMLYSIESFIKDNKSAKLTQEFINEKSEEATQKWYFRNSQAERESSTYCCLSLRSKLNLIGLDYAPIEQDEREALTEEQYLAIYAKNDKPNYCQEDGKILRVNFTDINPSEGKPIVQYTLEFNDSLRRNLAIHEHLRWNSFMISKGVIPASKELIMTELRADGKYSNGKNYALRRHGNITTFDDLITFRKMVAERDNSTEEKVDVIKYDYQLMDDAYWLLSQNGYKIVNKK